MCQIRSKKYDIGALAIGTEDGNVNIIPYPFDSTIWDMIKSHRSQITHLGFSRETNLIFSAGQDGNLFIYCLHEIQEIENMGNEQKQSNFNQLASILDEGLGENVLYPLENIFNYEENIKDLKNKVAENDKNEEKSSFKKCGYYNWTKRRNECNS